MFTYNTVQKYFGLIGPQSGKSSSTLQVEQSTFLFNLGDVIWVESRVDIVLNACNFTGNNGEHGALFIHDDSASLRTSNTTFATPIEGNVVAAYFLISDKSTKITDYMTYDTCFTSGDMTLNSSSADNLLQEAEAEGLVVIDNQGGFPYMVTQEETAFASCKFNMSSITYLIPFLHLLGDILLEPILCGSPQLLGKILRSSFDLPTHPHFFFWPIHY